MKKWRVFINCKNVNNFCSISRFTDYDKDSKNFSFQRNSTMISATAVNIDNSHFSHSFGGYQLRVVDFSDSGVLRICPWQKKLKIKILLWISHRDWELKVFINISLTYKVSLFAKVLLSQSLCYCYFGFLAEEALWTKKHYDTHIHTDILFIMWLLRCLEHFLHVFIKSWIFYLTKRSFKRRENWSHLFKATNNNHLPIRREINWLGSVIDYWGVTLRRFSTNIFVLCATKPQSPVELRAIDKF